MALGLGESGSQVKEALPQAARPISMGGRVSLVCTTPAFQGGDCPGPLAPGWIYVGEAKTKDEIGSLSVGLKAARESLRSGYQGWQLD